MSLPASSGSSDFLHVTQRTFLGEDRSPRQGKHTVPPVQGTPQGDKLHAHLLLTSAWCAASHVHSLQSVESRVFPLTQLGNRRLTGAGLCTATC